MAKTGGPFIKKEDLIVGVRGPGRKKRENMGGNRVDKSSSGRSPRL